MRPRSALLLLVPIFASSSLHGAIVQMKNGDRITGTVLKQQDETLFLKSEQFGILEIPTANVAKIIETPTPPPAPAAEVKEAPKPKGLLGMSSGGRYIVEVVKGFLKENGILGKWKSSIRLGYTLVSGEVSTSTTSTAIHTERQWKVNSVKVDYQQDYATSTDAEGNSSVTRDKLKVGVQFRHALNQRNFIQTDSQYSYAHVSGIDNDYLQTLGYGWKCLDTKSFKFTLVPALSLHYQDVVAGDTGMSLAPAIYEEVEYHWTEYVRIRNEAYALFPVDDNGGPTYHFSVLLQNRLVASLSLNLEYVFDYDGAVSASTNSAQHVLRTAFSFDF